MIFKPHSLKNLFQPEARGGWRFLRVGRVAMLAAGIVLGVFSLAHGAEVGFEMRDEGRAFQIQAPGLELGKMHFGALVQIDGINHRLDSLAGQLVGTEILADQPGPYGKTRATISTVRFENLKIDLLLKIERIEGTPCLLINAGIRNRSDRKISLG